MLRTYFSNQSQQVVHFIQQQQMDATSMHQCRVAIKKIRALLKLLSDVHPAFNSSKAEKPYRRLFKGLGAVREFHVREKLRSDAGLSCSAKQDLLERDKMHQATLRLEKMLNNSTVHDLKKQERRILTELKKQSKRKARHAIRRLQQHLVTELFAARQSSVQLHDLRKKIKTFYYNIKALQGNGVSAKPLLEHLDQVQQQLGDWHDTDELISYSHRHAQQTEIPNYRRLELKRTKLETLVDQTILTVYPVLLQFRLIEEDPL